MVILVDPGPFERRKNTNFSSNDAIPIFQAGMQQCQKFLQSSHLVLSFYRSKTILNFSNFIWIGSNFLDYVGNVNKWFLLSVFPGSFEKKKTLGAIHKRLQQSEGRRV